MSSVTVSFLLYAVVALSVIGTESAVPSDLVSSLPGITFSPTFKSYSGYLKATGSKKLHYWFTESSSSPASVPLVLWLNGGPGCSSLDGLLSEHGPFLVNEDGTKINPNSHAWNKVANMLYLEAPAGVGFSYSDDHNYTTTDDQVALDNHQALKTFLKLYPEFAQNELYITGESYGGVYIPTLAVSLMNDNSFNFKGFAIGNGLTDYRNNQNSLFYFMSYHGLIGAQLWTKMLQTCCKGSTVADRCDFVGASSNECKNLLKTAALGLNGLNIYNLYAECYQPKASNITKLASRFNPKMTLLSTPTSHKKLFKPAVGDNPPCIDAVGSTVYLNRPDVRKALHIPKSVKTWSICSDEVEQAYIRQYITVKGLFKKLLAAKKYRILLYNGDADMACNFLGDQWFVDDLGLQLLKPMRSWTYKAADGSKQVAGFSKVYSQKLVFTTIRGAGHMVPSDKPIVAFDMFSRFLGKQEF